MGRLRIALAVAAAVLAFVPGFVFGVYVGILLTTLVVQTAALLPMPDDERLFELGSWAVVALNGVAIVGCALLFAYAAFSLIQKSN